MAPSCHSRHECAFNFDSSETLDLGVRDRVMKDEEVHKTGLIRESQNNQGQKPPPEGEDTNNGDISMFFTFPKSRQRDDRQGATVLARAPRSMARQRGSRKG